MNNTRLANSWNNPSEIPNLLDIPMFIAVNGSIPTFPERINAAPNAISETPTNDITARKKKSSGLLITFFELS